MFGSIKQNKSSDHYLMQEKKFNPTDSDTSGEKIKLQYLNVRESSSVQEKDINQLSLDSNKELRSEVVDSNIVFLGKQNSKQFYIKRKENMFISQEMNESIGKNCWHAKTKRYGNDIKELERKLVVQKLFMNMVIHDMRNPAESI